MNITYNRFLTFFLFGFFMIIMMSSCQKEVIEISSAQDNETTKLTVNSTLTTLITDTVSNDGSIDNIIDKANCLEIKLPVFVVVNGTGVEINSIEDYQVIEEIFDRFNDDIDKIDIEYPIRVVTNEFAEILIDNENEFKELVNSCKGENEKDDDIECIDFMYPISISVFNTDFDIVDTKTINNDENLFSFLKNLNASTIASIKFPIRLVKADGTIISVNNNQELENAIIQAADSCDEDDDFNFNDDDPDYCNVDFVQQSLERCMWKITTFSNNASFENYSFRFSDDSTFTINQNGTIEGFGDWSVETSNNKNILRLSSTINDFNGDWEILECGDKFLDITKDGSILKIEKNCPDFSVEEVKETLLGCKWGISDFINNGENLSDQYIDYKFDFNNDETFEISDGSNTFPGSWTVERNEFGNVIINIASVFTDVVDEYFVASINNSNILIQSNSGKTIKLKKDCSTGVGDINVDRLNFLVLNCVWKIVDLNKEGNNLTANYTNYRFKFFQDGTFLFYNAFGADYYVGIWKAERTNRVVFLLTSQGLSNEITNFYEVILLEDEKLNLFVDGINGMHEMKLERECI
ncbi:hypothetical protein [Tenacibaculum jejuense]|uniref:Probable lipoprotein n=1 Tax=Tenacibaculum jejuense TaxID=584609 RepID=A0A238U9J5_9FLAO|nr:hypothetical protein [Tenacibaculum jejuense]SNR15725.1 Probable lipoprotein precursor [Tenacibaculum jejuense]